MSESVKPDDARRDRWSAHRVSASAGLTAALGPGRTTAEILTPEGRAPGQLSDPDPWQRYRITGLSTPPYPVPAGLPPEDEPGPDQHVRVAIIGAGLGGLGTAIALRGQGQEDFVILERAGSVGGTWRDNTYPGCACDIPSHLYSFSRVLNPAWSRSFSPQPEIRQYLERVTDRYRLRGRLRLNTELLQARWDGGANRWRLRTSRGELTADVLVSAAGPLAEPSQPDLPGLDTFPGPVFHSARWDHDCELTGKRIAVVGTGASAIQIVPAIAPGAARLTLFQRTPAWVIPRRDHPIGPARRVLYRHVPAAQRAVRTVLHISREALVGAFLRRPRRLQRAQKLALAHLHRAIADPGLRAALTPDYVMGCKRILLSDDFYPALARPTTDLVPAGLARIDGSALIAADGTVAEADVLIFATGFQATEPPVAKRIIGPGGTSLAQAWGEDMRALRGTTVAGFPNLCLVIGPNTGLGHNSMIHIIEAQARYIAGYVGALDRLGAAALDARPGAQERWCAWIERRMAPTVWATGGCSSWYQNAAGRNPTLWPGSIGQFRRATRQVDPREYDVIRGGV